MYEKVKEEECWEKTGRAPIRVRYLDINRGDEKNKEYRSRFVVQEIKRDNREDLFAATPPLEAKKLLFSLAMCRSEIYRGKKAGRDEDRFDRHLKGIASRRCHQGGIC